jgi:hypothetical protein
MKNMITSAASNRARALSRGGPNTNFKPQNSGDIRRIGSIKPVYPPAEKRSGPNDPAVYINK